MAGLMDGINKAVSKLTDIGSKAVDGAKDLLDKTDIDEKIVGAAKGLKDKAQAALDKTDIDEKIVDAAKGLKVEGDNNSDEQSNNNGHEINNLNELSGKNEIDNETNHDSIENKEKFVKENLQIINKGEKERNKTIENEIKSIIEILLLIHKFESEINKKYEESINSAANKIENCILIKKIWIDQFKQIYLNDEIKDYLSRHYLSDIIIEEELTYNNYMKDKKNFYRKSKEIDLKLNSNDFINFTLDDLSNLEKNKDILYPRDFYMINENIYSKLMKIYNKENPVEFNEQNENNKKIKYIINNKNIIFSYEYYLYKNENEINNKKYYYNILINNKNINNNIMEPLLIQCFENDKQQRDAKFTNYTLTKFILGKDINEIDSGIILRRPLKKNVLEDDISILAQIIVSNSLFNQHLKEKIKQNLEDLKAEEYYIIDKNWINFFRNFFGLKKFISLNKNNNLSDIDSLIKCDEFVNKKIKEKNKFDKCKKYIIKNVKEFGQERIEFYDDFEIINDSIKYLIEKLIQIKIKIKAKFLFDDKIIFVYFNDGTNQNTLLIGNIKKEMVFNTNILIKFFSNECMLEFLNELKIKKIIWNNASF